MWYRGRDWDDSEEWIPVGDPRYGRTRKEDDVSYYSGYSKAILPTGCVCDSCAEKKAAKNTEKPVVLRPPVRTGRLPQPDMGEDE